MLLNIIPIPCMTCENRERGDNRDVKWVYYESAMIANLIFIV